MFKKFRKIKGQSTVEYAVLIAIVIAALISIQMYIKRGVQGRLKSAADDIGDQYSTGNTNYSRRVHTLGNSQEKFESGVQSTKIIGDGETTYTTITSEILNVDYEYMAKPELEVEAEAVREVKDSSDGLRVDNERK
ncbi:MAG: hypothetical protein GY861_23875 [bacterium]|nr:hypothetical protein [bacterium]